MASKRRRRILMILPLLALVLFCLLWFGRGLAGRWTKLQASRSLEQHSVSAALDWLRWTSWLRPKDGEADLLRARAYRHLGRDEQLYQEALEAARRKGALRTAIEQEQRLYIIQSGTADEQNDLEMLALIEAGQSPHEVCAAFVFGYLNRQDAENARRVLEAWAADFPEEPHVTYMRGVFWRSLRDPAEAEAEFRAALEAQQRHELAALALARLYEEQQQADAALEQWIAAVKQFPSSDAACVGLAQLLRKSGRVSEARRVLAPRLRQASPPREVLLEASDIAFESGQYEEACRFLAAAQLEHPSQFRQFLARGIDDAVEGKLSRINALRERSRAAATMLAFGGEMERAEWIFRQVNGIYSQVQRRGELRFRLGHNPEDPEALRELDEIITRLTVTQHWDLTKDSTNQGIQNSHQGQHLYAQHCAACHGTLGDGNGPAARHLDPRPRDLRRHQLRLVSTRNAIPSVEDVAEVIRRGMPGTSMPAFADLNAQELQLLAEEVLRLRAEGMREYLTASLENDPETSEDELTKLLELHTAPAPPQTIPPLEAPDARALVRGKQAFEQLNCHSCHQVNSEPTREQLFFDEYGRPAPARNLVRDPLKGGREPESIYLRIRLGMPGTAHPASSSAAEETLVDLVHYCRSLAQEPTRSLTNYQRTLRSLSLPAKSGPQSQPAEGRELGSSRWPAY